MCKIVMTDDSGMYKICYASDETPKDIFRYYNINTSTKNIFMNGELLTEDTMKIKMPEQGTIHIAIESKAAMRR